MEQKNIMIIGGDKRISYVAERMAKNGYTVKGFGLIPISAPTYTMISASDCMRVLSESDIVILPLPATRNGQTVAGQNTDMPTLQQIIENSMPGAVIYGGMLPHSFVSLCREHNITVHDYYCWERVTAANSVPTAHGVLKLILSTTEKTLDSTRILVTGYGRCGRIICHQLNALGADVIAFARRGGDRASAEGMGIPCQPFSALPHEAATADFIVNTVPALVLTAPVIYALPSSACIIDIASAPYGTDFDAAEQAGIHTVQAGSLPGKAAPQSAGNILADSIISHLRGEEID